MKLSKREIILLYVLVIALIAFVAVTFLINPMVKSISDKGGEKDALQTEYRMKRYELTSLDDIDNKINTLKSELETTGQKFGELRQDTELFKFVSKYYEGYGFELNQFALGDSTKIPDTNITSQSVVFTITRMFSDMTELDSVMSSFVSDFPETFMAAVLSSITWRSQLDCTVSISFTIYSANK